MGRFYHGPAGWENHRVPRAEGAELITGGLAENRLRTQLEASYGIRVTGLTELDAGVFRVGRPDGPDWVARVFSPERPAAAVAGDAGILRFLASNEFPAERLATPESVSQADGRAWPANLNLTCGNWTSSTFGVAMLGHIDKSNNSSWNAAHMSRACSQPDLIATGGNGLFYCFAAQ